ncbi:PREDICTED: uncharacterized protein LOC104819751 [Tarenaya hassleriana]|uniref:uncharacterized protein LOC104819751 n=1 Tax=Tarenaya hassleriana TaxID=28532 RepID=UPI00053C2539|nr:PREDICTED: uncharacterized protein LOC104819751 [Tarenaya hassleriana]
MDEDPFLRQYQPSELKIASEFLTTWLPFLSRDLCKDCVHVLSNRIRSLDPGGTNTNVDDGKSAGSSENGGDLDTHSLGSWKDGGSNISESVAETSSSALISQSPVAETASPRMSWADMSQEDELEEEEEQREGGESGGQAADASLSPGDLPVTKTPEKPKLSREQRENIRLTNVKRKKDFICLERVRGRIVNIVDGLELHTGVFSAVEQKRIVDFVYELQEKGRKGELKERTYSAPQKWMRGKGRVTLQFGCCYNYATDKAGNPPGILQHEMVDPIPHLFKVMIRRLVQWHVLPPTCVPDSCIVNIYEESDCIPPHIDNHDFVRPFCTVSFLSECNILFGSNLKVEGPGEFSGSFAIPLPVGSVLVLSGNGADVAKHCVPAVPTNRISITFRRMDESKRPAGFVPEPDLQGIQPLPYEPNATSSLNSSRFSHNGYNREAGLRREEKPVARDYHPERGNPSYESREWSTQRRRRPGPQNHGRNKVKNTQS